MTEQLRPGRIVVGVDCSDKSGDVLRWAWEQAQLTGASLTAVSGWRIDLPGVELSTDFAATEAHTLAVLRDLVAETLPADHDAVTTLVSDSPPALALIAESQHAQLLVVGPRSASAIEELLLGSVTETVLSQAGCPVAVVHDALRARHGRIVVGVDGSPSSRRALAWAATQAGRTGSVIDAIVAWDWAAEYGVYPYGPPADEVQRRAVALLDAELGRLHGVQVQAHVVHSNNPARELLAAGDRADLIVVGNNRPGATAARLLGSVSRKVTRLAKLPVVVVHDHDQLPGPLGD